VAFGDVLFVSEDFDVSSYEAVCDASSTVYVGSLHDDAILYLGVADGGSSLIVDWPNFAGWYVSWCWFNPRSVLPTSLCRSLCRLSISHLSRSSSWCEGLGHLRNRCLLLPCGLGLRAYPPMMAWSYAG